MNAINKIGSGDNSDYPVILDFIRMLLGLLLIAKGARFLNNAALLRDLLMENKAISLSPGAVTALIYFITYTHLTGGILIFLGLVTRLAAMLQLPIVFGAVFFINILPPFFNSDLLLSMLVLALLVLFVVIGSGSVSLDRLFLNFKINKDELS